jgi:hypothetical protein
MVISPLFFLGYQISGGFKRSNQCRQRIIMRLFNTFKRCHILQRGPKKIFGLWQSGKPLGSKRGRIYRWALEAGSRNA